MHYVRFLAAFVVYTVIDVGWNISPIAMGMYESLYEASGNDALLDQFGRKMDTSSSCSVRQSRGRGSRSQREPE